MASIVKYGTQWRAQLYVGGVRESSVFEDKFEAETWAKQREAELRILKKSIRTMKRFADNQKVFLAASDSYSEEEIVSGSMSIPTTCGVYFLIRGSVIVYVGQSINVHQRVMRHRASKQFDRINVIECDEKDLNSLELLYIKKFKPILNILGVDCYSEQDMALEAVSG